jgi:hypothetical protein
MEFNQKKESSQSVVVILLIQHLNVATKPKRQTSQEKFDCQAPRIYECISGMDLVHELFVVPIVPMIFIKKPFN